MDDNKRIKTKAQLKEYLDTELALYPVKGLRQWIAYFFQIGERDVLRKYIKLMRKAEYHQNAGHRLRGIFYFTRFTRLQTKTGVHMPINCCGKGLSIAHLEPCGFTTGTVVGENCRLHTVSFTMCDSDGVAPVIGDNVIIGMGSMIIGGVTIADNITIGAGAVVTKSFLEPGITIAGVPAKKISDSRKTF